MYIQFQIKNEAKPEPTPTVIVDQIQDEKSNGEENIEVDPPISSESSRSATKLSDSINSNPCLRPSPSETSLTRSRSLEFPAQPKHSPDCKDNPYKL